MSKTEQVKVGKFIEEYLFKRKNISLIIFLLDIRHKPTENDMLMYNYIISRNLPFVVIANKADKVSPTKVDASVEELKGYLEDDNIHLFPFSSERKIYSDAVWNEIEKYI